MEAAQEPRSANRDRLDLLAVEVYTWSPHLETAVEICLRHAAAGRRVGFAFLDIENFDSLARGTILGSRIWPYVRRTRLVKVEHMEGILRGNGVAVIPFRDRCASRTPLSGKPVGIDSVDSLRDYRFDGAALGVGVLSSLIHHAGDINPELKDYRSLVDHLLASAQEAFTLTRELIEQFEPTEVLVFNGRLACAKGIAEAARISGVEVLHYEIGATPDRFYLSNRSPHNMENGRERLRDCWSRGGEGREAVGARFFTRGRGGAALHQPWPDVQEPGKSVPRIGRRRRIVYYASSIDEFAALEDGVESFAFDSQRSAVEWLVSWVSRRPDTELIIRLHPKMGELSPRERNWWDSLAAQNISILHADSTVDSYALAASADRIVCFHSSMGAEATYLGGVSILVGDALYRGLDCVYEPRSLAELDLMLQDTALVPKVRENCLPFGYYRLMHGTKYRFYQPESRSGGSFFGEPVNSPEPRLFDHLRFKAWSAIDARLRLARRIRSEWRER